MAVKRVAIYVRISSDRGGGGEGVARQRLDCQDYAATRGWSVVEVFEDNDVSAWSGRPRPRYLAMLDTVRAGRVDTVICWHTDRLTRSARDLEDIIDACSPFSVMVHSVTESPVDLSTPSGQMQARIVVAFARHESDQKAIRIRRKHQDLAESGAPASLKGSYGYNDDGTLNEYEAGIIRDLAQRLLAGESLRSLTSWLNEEAVPTKKGGTTWRSSTLKAILTSGRICGYREWTPRTPRTPEDRQGWDGKPRRGHGDGALTARGEWEAIITLETHQAIRALVNDPSRKATKRRHYLLSGGLLKCGAPACRAQCGTDPCGCEPCGNSLNHKVESRHPRLAQRDPEGRVVKDVDGRTVKVTIADGPATKHGRYACIRQPDRGCGRISIAAPELDALVTERIFTALDGVDLAPHPPQPTKSVVLETRSQIADVETAIARAFDEYTDGQIDRKNWLRQRERQEAKLATLRSRLPATDQSAVLLALPSGSDALRKAWPSMDLDRQRAIAHALIDRVIVNPSTLPTGTARFDPTRITVIWKV